MKRNYTQKLYTYTSLLFTIAVLAACKPNIIPVTYSLHDKGITSNTIAVEIPASVDGKIAIDEHTLAIDTLLYSIHTRISSIHTNSIYLDKKVRAKTAEFYNQNHFQTKWLGEQAPTSLYYTLVDILKSSSRYGLRPEDYSTLSFGEQLSNLYADPAHAASRLYDLDAQLTDVFFLFTTHVTEGRIAATNNGTKLWIKETPKGNDLNTLLKSTDTKTLIANIEKLHPTQEQYAKLQAALEQYKEFDSLSSDHFKTIYITGKLKPNDVHEVIPTIRRKLALTDLKLDSLMLDSTRYDDALVSAVKWFQLRHGLEPDGIIGAGTVKFLNQSFKEKAEVIALNLERMRWLPETYGDNYIIVNVPEYKLRVFENQKLGLEMKVIVGAEDKATPIFSDTLKYIVFSPTWSVPISIIRDEIIPRLQRDSAYYNGKTYTFYKNGIEFDPASVSWKNEVNANNYAVVQQPGRDNALGLAKFIMPNKMSIYLHDTPNHSLFNKNNRALSHGCVRLDDPDKLAAYLLKDQRGWDEDKIDTAMHSEQTQTVFLKKPYHVQIEYRTAWVDDNGLVNFRDDVYGHDKKQLAQLNDVRDQVLSKK